jgi:hypothetical protein
MQQKEIRNKLTGAKMTFEQFHELNPEYKPRCYLPEIVEKAKTGKLKIEDVKNFYKLKGLTLDDFKDDTEVYSYNYWNFHHFGEFNEMSYIIEQHRKFILENYLKKKA